MLIRNTSEAPRRNAEDAERLAKIATRLGYEVEYIATSGLSASHYLALSLPGEPGVIKIRIANHDLPEKYDNDANFEVRQGWKTWHDAAVWLAGKVGKPAPAEVKRAESLRAAAKRREAEKLAKYQVGVLQGLAASSELGGSSIRATKRRRDFVAADGKVLAEKCTSDPWRLAFGFEKLDVEPAANDADVLAAVKAKVAELISARMTLVAGA